MSCRLCALAVCPLHGHGKSIFNPGRQQPSELGFILTPFQTRCSKSFFGCDSNNSNSTSNSKMYARVPPRFPICPLALILSLFLAC
jgi:hypothetical protein